MEIERIKQPDHVKQMFKESLSLMRRRKRERGKLGEKKGIGRTAHERVGERKKKNIKKF